MPSAVKRLDRVGILRDYRKLTAEQVAAKYGCKASTVRQYAWQAGQGAVAAILASMYEKPGKSFRRWFQFGLRDALWAVALACVLLGWRRSSN